MPEASPLPHLIRLLEDPAPVVQEAVWRELTTFGTTLETELDRCGLTDDPGLIERLRELDSQRRRDAVISNWHDWFDLEDEYDQLEHALNLLTCFQETYSAPGRLTRQLDRLAQDYRDTGDPAGPKDLAKFLFGPHRLRGATSEYAKARMSNLAAVIDQGHGNPISLTCIFMLVGNRLGISVHGCNFPGHFLARALIGAEVLLIDCFNGGQFIPANAFHDLSPDTGPKVRDLVHRPARAHAIVTRVLRNLDNAYHLENDPDGRAVMQELLRIQQVALETGGYQA